MIRERCWFWSCRRKGQMKMCLHAICYVGACNEWFCLFDVHFIFTSPFVKLFHGFKPWNSLFQLLLLTCSIFMYSDHDIVASFLVNKSASLLEDNILKLQDDIFYEMNVPNTKVFTWLITLVLFNPYFLNFDSNSFVESGCYPVSRAFHWIKHNKGRVWGWSSWKWFKNNINRSKSNQELVWIFGCKRLISQTDWLLVRRCLLFWGAKISWRNYHYSTTECFSFAESANTIQLHLEFLYFSNTGKFCRSEKSTDDRTSSNNSWGLLIICLLSFKLWPILHFM